MQVDVIAHTLIHHQMDRGMNTAWSTFHSIDSRQRYHITIALHVRTAVCIYKSAVFQCNLSYLFVAISNVGLTIYIYLTSKNTCIRQCLTCIPLQHIMSISYCHLCQLRLPTYTYYLYIITLLNCRTPNIIAVIEFQRTRSSILRYSNNGLIGVCIISHLCIIGRHRHLGIFIAEAFWHIHHNSLPCKHLFRHVHLQRRLFVNHDTNRTLHL